MAHDYAKMTADLIARMSRPREQALCFTCHANTSALDADTNAQCAGCIADDLRDDIELEAVTRPLRTCAVEVACV